LLFYFYSIIQNSKYVQIHGTTSSWSSSSCASIQTAHIWRSFNPNRGQLLCSFWTNPKSQT